MITVPGQLLTPRLILRKPLHTDAGDIYTACAKDPDVTRYLMRSTEGSLREVEEFLDRMLATWEGGSAYAWPIFLRGNGELVGMIEARVDGYMVNISYVIGRAHWNRGFATEAVRALCAWAAAEPDVFRIWAVCAVDNPASARVLEKAGMTREGILRRWAVFPNLDGAPRDCYSYSLVSDSMPPAARPSAVQAGP
jgi:[ribosomal protein S5]-alanine N-acetyltransferase